jgi:preprotein translocase subunit SecG
MMDKYLVVAIVIAICIVMVIYTQRGGGSSRSGNTSFKDIVQKEFMKYKVIEKIKSL